jgi:hypothetical protein
MKNLLFPAMLVSFAALAATPVAAQQRNSFTAQQRLGTVPPRPPHALNRSMSLSAPATSPLQRQMQNNYATQLMGAQRELLRQNPSGLTRGEVAIGHELNGFTPR